MIVTGNPERSVGDNPRIRFRLNEIGRKRLLTLELLVQKLKQLDETFVGATALGSQVKGTSRENSDIDINFFIDPTKIPDSLLDILEKKSRPLPFKQIARTNFIKRLQSLTPGFFKDKTYRSLFQQKGEDLVFDVSNESLESLVRAGMNLLAKFPKNQTSYDIAEFYSANYSYIYENLRPIYRLFELSIGGGLKERRQKVLKLIRSTSNSENLRNAFWQAIMLMVQKEERSLKRNEVAFMGYPPTLTQAIEYFGLK